MGVLSTQETLMPVVATNVAYDKKQAKAVYKGTKMVWPVLYEVKSSEIGYDITYTETTLYKHTLGIQLKNRSIFDIIPNSVVVHIYKGESISSPIAIKTIKLNNLGYAALYIQRTGTADNNTFITESYGISAKAYKFRIWLPGIWDASTYINSTSINFAASTSSGLLKIPYKAPSTINQDIKYELDREHFLYDNAKLYFLTAYTKGGSSTNEIYSTNLSDIHLYNLPQKSTGTFGSNPKVTKIELTITFSQRYYYYSDTGGPHGTQTRTWTRTASKTYANNATNTNITTINDIIKFSNTGCSFNYTIRSGSDTYTMDTGSYASVSISGTVTVYLPTENKSVVINVSGANDSSSSTKTICSTIGWS